MGTDIMANVLTFLEPPEILQVLTIPLSKDWRQTFTSQQELWRVLCLVDPFKAHIDNDDCSSSDESMASFPPSNKFGRCRLLYTTFVRCMLYLSRIKDDAINGRPPSSIDYGTNGGSPQAAVGSSKSLKRFLTRARGMVGKSEWHQHLSEDAGIQSTSLECSPRILPYQESCNCGTCKKDIYITSID
jgi:hypothetical protein